jgi:hypothetical protein
LADTLLVWLLLLLAVGGQATAFASQPGSHHESGHCCVLCHGDTLPFLNPAGASSCTPILQIAPVAALADCEPADEILPASATSRAPPAV